MAKMCLTCNQIHTRVVGHQIEQSREATCIQICRNVPAGFMCLLLVACLERLQPAGRSLSNLHELDDEECARCDVNLP
jgi:hypothetical protein